MFSCSHYSNFVCDRIEKQSACHKEVKKRLPMAKPRPTVPVKATSVNLVSRSPWSARKNFRKTLDIRSIRGTTMKSKLIILAQGGMHGSHQIQEPKVLKWSDRKMLKVQIRGKTIWSVGIFKLYYHTESCVGTNSKNRISKHEVHEPSAHDQDLTFLTKEFGNYRRIPNILIGSIEDTCVDMRMFMSSSMKAAIHLGPNFLVNLEVYKKKNLEEIQSLINITQIDFGAFWRNSECDYDWQLNLLHGRDPYSLTVKWSSGQMQKYVSTQIPLYAWEE